MHIFTHHLRPGLVYKYRLRRILSGWLFILLPSIVFAQSKTIKGTVTDEKGGALPGVSVAVKGGSGGAATDVNGRYSINVADANGALVFSFIGYTKQEAALKGRSQVDVML